MPLRKSRARQALQIAARRPLIVAVGAHAHDHGGEQRARVAVAGEDRAHDLAGEVGRDVLGLALDGGLVEQPPDGGQRVAPGAGSIARSR